MPFFPTLVHIGSDFNRHTILLKQPIGHPVLASRKPDWKIALSEALRECHADLRGNTFLVARAWWSSFIGCAERGIIPASGLFLIPGPYFILNVASFSRLLPIPGMFFSCQLVRRQHKQLGISHPTITR